MHIDGRYKSHVHAEFAKFESFSNHARKNVEHSHWLGTNLQN